MHRRAEHRAPTQMGYASNWHPHRHYWVSEQYPHGTMAWNGHRRWRGSPGTYYRTDFTESALAPYNYVSRSSVTYTETRSNYDGGYGGRDTIPATMSGERMDPWHSYGMVCPWQ